MQKLLSLKEQILVALFAAVYVALTLLVAPVSYGIIQLRISEVLNHLLVYNKKYILALGLGVFIANFWSPFFLYDIIFGTLATLFSAVISIYAFKCIKHKLARLCFNALNFSIIGMLPIALLNIFLGAEETFFPLYISMVISELAILVIGAVIFEVLDRTLHLSNILN